MTVFEELVKSWYERAMERSQMHEACPSIFVNDALICADELRLAISQQKSLIEDGAA